MALEKKFSDAYKEYLVKDSASKWTGGKACRHIEKRVRYAMNQFSIRKMNAEDFLDHVAKTNLNIMDLMDEGRRF